MFFSCSEGFEPDRRCVEFCIDGAESRAAVTYLCSAWALKAKRAMDEEACYEAGNYSGRD